VILGSYDNKIWLLIKIHVFSVITPHHDIAEILLKVALNTKNQSINQSVITQKTNINQTVWRKHVLPEGISAFHSFTI
jgi:hypothetical protein